MPFQVEYLWTNGNLFFSKFRTLDSLDSPPTWNFDGSSTSQSHSEITEILLKPIHLFTGPSNIVLCECYDTTGKPTSCNTRSLAREIFQENKYESWFGLEQEYVIMENNRPLGWPSTGYPEPQGIYYCSHGIHMKGRKFALEHYKLCLQYGIKIAGINAEVMPGQWEFQIGVGHGIEASDHLTMARFLLCKLGEEYGYTINYNPKPVKGPWNGSGCHINMSTKETRESGGLEVIQKFISHLDSCHNSDMTFYGDKNEERLSGLFETSHISEFTSGIGTRNTSIRIPTEVAAKGCGYFEDRRPGANIDPYVVTSKLYKNYFDFQNENKE